MASRSTASFARMVVLIVLVSGAIMGGNPTVSTHTSSSPTEQPDESVAAVPTEESLFDLTSTEEAAPTSEPAQTVAEPEPTIPPTEVPQPTEEPQQLGRGDFPVPENTTGRSIVIERGPEDENSIALTFDAGEGAGYTEEILDLLLEYNLKASFGVTGEWAREYPDLVNRILDEGHMLFNHSESHLSWTGASPGTEPLTPEQRVAEVAGAHESIVEVADWDARPFWRPPYGDLDAEGQELLAEMGYDYTFWWTCDTLAWMETSAAEIAARCAPDSDFGGPGAIILMHVAQEQDYLAVEQIIQDYSAEGYEFVTLDKMIGE